MSYEHYFKPTNPQVVMVVQGFGTIEIELFPEVAPNTVYNFIDLVQKGYYTGLKFHRIIPNFMIQGGWGPELKPIRGDFKQNGFNNPLLHDRGVISMARTSNPNSATSQFFIMHKPSPHLDGAYAAFGVVTKGIEVVDAIVRSPRDYSDKPHTDIVIESVTIDLKGQSYPKPQYV
ncbi:peptidylprolyl isomerase [Paracholeplasma manati]|uniref:Peptidyl-prolyl cis-trans isomerase n=1 Tax=Paracholeplasma manati TaxID=591373 RepID=A0ABT2Y610_9MOLU|nr:peptidylprolyl isomerase [Paracholeplasma manati]MCV2232180.1 peptidylprolyl isomerase [Paracholeplasma manati]MDG0888137.1 peptidylprolyl isomerase [Paracholeplasma manati]